MHTWVYEGPVKEFERVISSHWYGETRAATEKKARSNLAYQYKRYYQRTTKSKITLPGKIRMID